MRLINTQVKPASVYFVERYELVFVLLYAVII